MRRIDTHFSRLHGRRDGAKSVRFPRRAAQLFAMALSSIALSMTAAHATDTDPGVPDSGIESVDTPEPIAFDGTWLPEAPMPEPEESAQKPESQQAPEKPRLDSIVQEALEMIGIPYKWGGNNPEEGLDCSGFVRYVYRQVTGMLLPRESAQISKTGDVIAQSDLHPGDLVFFNTRRGQATHVGIYMGKQQFIHAPTQGAYIRVESMTSRYWASRYYGARRVVG
jgi:cell wall-associated NlpC family hydrolase